MLDLPTLIALPNEEHFAPQINAHPDHSPDSSIHALKSTKLGQINRFFGALACESPPLVNTAMPLPLWAPRSMNLAPAASVMLPENVQYICVLSDFH